MTERADGILLVRCQVVTGELVPITTSVGFFVVRAWATEAIRPGVCDFSHHMGRWLLHEGEGSRWVSAQVNLTHPSGPGTWLLRYRSPTQPFASSDPDSERIVERSRWCTRTWLCRPAGSAVRDELLAPEDHP